PVKGEAKEDALEKELKDALKMLKAKEDACAAAEFRVQEAIAGGKAIAIPPFMAEEELAEEEEPEETSNDEIMNDVATESDHDTPVERVPSPMGPIAISIQEAAEEVSSVVSGKTSPSSDVSVTPSVAESVARSIKSVRDFADEVGNVFAGQCIGLPMRSKG
ncbi:hypothetical protein THAOC_16746, partial [Thalassiosira oceanica]